MSEDLDRLDAPPLGTKLRGDYELIRFLGAGGMGAVYEALMPGNRRVAVKVLLGKASRAQGGEFVERFKREANVMSTLDSPHIVRSIDAGIDPTLGIPFMVMPLLVGLDLQGLIERIGPLHPVVAVRIIRQACLALEITHAAGVVHRDIKPANLFLDHDQAGNVVVRVLDFGIAKWCVQDTALTRTGSLLGTPHYMSPEQCQSGKDVDARTDVWSLGASLYEALTGQLPFAEATNLSELYISIMTCDSPALQGRAPWVEAGLASVVHGTLVRDLDARCPTARDLAAALQPFAADSDELTAGMLIELLPEVHTHLAPRGELPVTWNDVVAAPPPAMVFEVIDVTSDPLLGQSIAGRHTLLRRLGEGGMGAVYEARESDGSRVAVKVIGVAAAGGGEDVRRRFVREARAVMSIESENVVRVTEADTDPEQQLPYLVMELLQGTDLGVLLERLGAVTPRTVARLFVQACRGLQAAHAQGFVHRDIKPTNLFLHQLPSDYVILKICDFGIVKRVADDQATVQLTRTGGVVGSPMFMSPEQSKSARNIDLRTDVWSLGASLFQALSGTPLWAGRDTVGALIVAICTEPVPHLQDRAPWVPKGLADVVHRALSRDLGQRFQTMAELEQALLPFAEGTHHVRLEDLVPVADQERAQVAPRAAATELSSVGAASVVQTVAEPPKRSTAPALITAATAVVAIGATSLFFALRGPDETTAPPEPAADQTATGQASEPTGSPEVPSHQVRVEIVPATATVTVDGKVRELRDGSLELSGEPGTTFTVEVVDGDRKRERTVTITKDGTASPNKLTLAEPSASPAARRPPVGRTAKPPATKTGKPPPPATKPKPTATGVKGFDDWNE